MKFPIWLIPIIAMAIILPLISAKKENLKELTPKEKRKMIALTVLGVIILVVGIIAFLFLARS